MAAAVILEDAEKYGGEQAGVVRWAKSVMARKEADELTAPAVGKNQSAFI